MAKNTKIFSRKFIIGLLIYVVLFLVVAAVGLGVFWKFIASYEASRPKNTLKAYVEQLTVEQMCEGSDELYASVDQNIQSREQFDQVIRDAVTESVSYAKKSSESTENRQVYVLRTGKTPVGRFVIEAGEADVFGFRIWEVAESSFDFSYLMTEGISVTVPEDYKVSLNGHLLSESYITKTGIEYTSLGGFYDDYDLPAMVTYSASNFLGEGLVEVADNEGNVVEITDQTDMNDLLPKVSQQEADAIAAFTEEFVQLWVKFSGSQKNNAVYNYYQVKNVLSSDGALSERLRTAIDGLAFGQTNGASIQDVIINRIVPLAEGTYMCDMTYLVRTVGKKGPVDTSSNMKIIIVTENEAYKVKSMERY